MNFYYIVLMRGQCHTWWEWDMHVYHIVFMGGDDRHGSEPCLFWPRASVQFSTDEVPESPYSWFWMNFWLIRNLSLFPNSSQPSTFSYAAPHRVTTHRFGFRSWPETGVHPPRYPWSPSRPPKCWQGTMSLQKTEWNFRCWEKDSGKSKRNKIIFQVEKLRCEDMKC